MVKLGEVVTDSVTGFSGVAVSRTVYLNGCVRIAVQARAKDNQIADPVYFDEQQLESPAGHDKPGGERPGPRGLPNPPF